MKVKICVLILVSCILCSGCSLFPISDKVVYDCSIDTDAYTYYNLVKINMYECHDTLEINVESKDKEDDWRWVLAGFIKKFAYVDGILIIQYYDKWYTFDVYGYEPENMHFNLDEYETLEELEQVYSDLDSFEWKSGRYKRTEEEIKINGWYEGYKITIPYYKETVPEYKNIGETDSSN